MIYDPIGSVLSHRSPRVKGWTGYGGEAIHQWREQFAGMGAWVPWDQLPEGLSWHQLPFLVTDGLLGAQPCP